MIRHGHAPIPPSNLTVVALQLFIKYQNALTDVFSPRIQAEREAQAKQKPKKKASRKRIKTS